jgi:peptidyl-prolyl cis-trans isomerase C
LPVLALLMSFVFSCLSQAVLAAPKEPPPKETTTEVLAQIGKTVITKAEIDALIETLPPEFKVNVETTDQKKRFLDAYVQGNILAMEAKAQNIDKKKAMQTRIEYVVMGLLAQEYAKDVTAKAPKATDADIKKYFESHKAQFTTPAMVAAKHILVKVDAPAKPEEEKAAKAKIEGIKKELDGGANFEKTAEKYSDDPTSKSKGGDLGLFPKERMPPEFAQTAFALKKGEISAPVKTPYGYHIIKVYDIKPENTLKLKDEIPRIRIQLENQARQDAMQKEIDRLKKKYAVTINP